MHEFSLYAQVPAADHARLLQQLAGVARMQPKPVKQIHLVFKSQTPPALSAVAAKDDTKEQQQEKQRVMKMLTTGLYYMQVVGRVVSEAEKSANGKVDNGDVEMTNSQGWNREEQRVRWHLEFKDTPEAGKQAISGRFTAKIPIDDGNIMNFMKNLGFDYISRYMVVGDKFVERDTTLFLHKVMCIPQAWKDESPITCDYLEYPGNWEPLDETGGYLLQASIDAVEGNQEIKDRVFTQLLAMKETLNQAVNLTPGDRLALDTKFTAARRD